MLSNYQKNMLMALGSTQNEIAASLTKLGIKGMRHALPYLNRNVSLLSQFVLRFAGPCKNPGSCATNSCCVDSCVDWYISDRNNPLRVLVDFDEAFDKGAYPELER